MKNCKKNLKIKKNNFNLKKLENIFFLIKGKKYSNNKIFHILDSIQILDFISEIEKRFKIKFKSSQINEKNFTSLNSILKLIDE